MKRATKSSRPPAKAESPHHPGTGEELDGVEELMKVYGIEPTRENYLDLAYLGNPPKELGEEEGFLPEKFRR